MQAATVLQIPQTIDGKESTQLRAEIKNVALLIIQT